MSLFREMLSGSGNSVATCVHGNYAECELCGEVEEDDDELLDGTILPGCPHYGQYCEIPTHYYINKRGNNAYANSYCKRCKKKVKLTVVFY